MVAACSEPQDNLGKLKSLMIHMLPFLVLTHSKQMDFRKDITSKLGGALKHCSFS